MGALSPFLLHTLVFKIAPRIPRCLRWLRLPLKPQHPIKQLPFCLHRMSRRKRRPLTRSTPFRKPKKSAPCLPQICLLLSECHLPTAPPVPSEPSWASQQGEELKWSLAWLVVGLLLQKKGYPQEVTPSPGVFLRMDGDLGTCSPGAAVLLERCWSEDRDLGMPSSSLSAWAWQKSTKKETFLPQMYSLNTQGCC